MKFPETVTLPDQLSDMELGVRTSWLRGTQSLVTLCRDGSNGRHRSVSLTLLSILSRVRHRNASPSSREPHFHWYLFVLMFFGCHRSDPVGLRWNRRDTQSFPPYPT
jgi:hypothetical protein